MQDKLLSKTRIGQYVESAWTGQNTSGITPIGDQILILPDKSVEMTLGGIIMPESLRETHSLAAESGVIAAIGAGAWTWNTDRTRRFEGVKPEVGQRICFTRYSGMERFGKDGEMYRIMEDKCIGALVDVEEINPPAQAA
jgi:co-chaperonin GroES (HSP10)